MKSIFKQLPILALAAYLFNPIISYALEFPSPLPGNSMVGHVQNIMLQPGDTFFQMARKYNIGYEALAAANPNVDPFQARKKPIPFIIPSNFILPPGDRHGIVINLAEMKLYFYSDDGQNVFVFPIGVGRQGWATPTGQTFVLQKIKNPYWHVPDSIREHAAEQGVYYPDKVAPGPLDPLGNYALRLNIPGYLIHGTNDPNSIGARSSSGCIRMYPESIENLFDMVQTKEPVQIIDAPFKVGVNNGTLYLEAHPPMEDNHFEKISDVTPMLQAILADSEKLHAKINWKAAAEVAKEHLGIPKPIGVVEASPETISAQKPTPAFKPAPPVPLINNPLPSSDTDNMNATKAKTPSAKEDHLSDEDKPLKVRPQPAPVQRPKPKDTLPDSPDSPNYYGGRSGAPVIDGAN